MLTCLRCTIANPHRETLPLESFQVQVGGGARTRVRPDKLFCGLADCRIWHNPNYLLIMNKVKQFTSMGRRCALRAIRSVCWPEGKRVQDCIIVRIRGKRTTDDFFMDQARVERVLPQSRCNYIERRCAPRATGSGSMLASKGKCVRCSSTRLQEEQEIYSGTKTRKANMGNCKKAQRSSIPKTRTRVEQAASCNELELLCGGRAHHARSVQGYVATQGYIDGRFRYLGWKNVHWSEFRFNLQTKASYRTMDSFHLGLGAEEEIK
ncbi:hypothetical protein B0H13DRAFT_1868728 [Mycena leptocephala]|nr:hypothetical protein B0H13DRAFT_1868728 [Mycena leptocephala]